MPAAEFPLGLFLATPGALALLNANHLQPGPFVDRHLSGDFGDVPPADAAANRQEIAAFHSRREPGRVLSTYTVGGERLWVMTCFSPEAGADSNYTTLILPDEY